MYVKSDVSVYHSCSAVQGVYEEGEERQTLDGDKLTEDDYRNRERQVQLLPESEGGCDGLEHD